ncbi:cytochrome b5 [Micractinium conductrix]|uniref:Cytochrome b5 n=1 Tax=Micractinium conductrix TaxID=554055 RepID=A0A2P6UZH8_9CHLO|nr:cytochrome b5 [Micractinium conductrix]|eukprot:PSC67239.1 cytochrome b5 [Micractinium conductrix]
MPSWTPRLPISWVAGLLRGEQEPREPAPPVRLAVVDAPAAAGPALVSPTTADALRLRDGRGFLCLAEGSDCVLPVAADASVADGQLAVDAVQQYNLHLGAGISDDFRAFEPPAGEPFELAEVEAEVAQLGRGDGQALQVDARQLAKQLLRSRFSTVLALGEAVVLPWPAGGSSDGGDAGGGARLLLRVTAVHTLDQQAREEAVGYHCYRGLLTHDAQICLTTPGAPRQQQQQQQPQAPGQQQHQQQQQAQKQAQKQGQQQGAAGSCGSSEVGGCGGESPEQLPQSMAAGRGRVVLLNVKQRPAAGPSRNCVLVHTTDAEGEGETFPVQRKLLRPCIALTKAVRSEGEGAPGVTLAVDTLTFDRVLIFLEALALQRQPPAFGLHLCPQLLEAAQQLGLRALEECCRERLGESQARLRFYSFAEIRELNARGGCWLILDGMVLDVTRWLPEHPGGSRIIPEQSLNLDCSRMFEIFHASRESFIYLQQFYAGEVSPEDLPLVPPPSEPPSAEFLDQLRQYTPWRLRAAEPVTHLGAKKR